DPTPEILAQRKQQQCPEQRREFEHQRDLGQVRHAQLPDQRMLRFEHGLVQGEIADPKEEGRDDPHRRHSAPVLPPCQMSFVASNKPFVYVCSSRRATLLGRRVAAADRGLWTYPFPAQRFLHSPPPWGDGSAAT